MLPALNCHLFLRSSVLLLSILYFVVSVPTSLPTYSPTPNLSLEPTQINRSSPTIEPTRQCFDPNEVDLDRICSLIYKPVCGCNNYTYSNECHAEREGCCNCYYDNGLEKRCADV